MAEAQPQRSHPISRVLNSLSHWFTAAKERLNDIIYLIILSHALSVGILRISTHSALKHVLNQKCLVSFNIGDPSDSQTCMDHANDRLAEVLTAQSSWEILGE